MTARSTQGRTVCRRCERRFDEHLRAVALPGAALNTADPKCPDGSGRTFQKRQHSGFGNTFSADEVLVASEMLEGLTRKRDLQHLVRHPAFASLARKVSRMNAQRKGRKDA